MAGTCISADPRFTDAGNGNFRLLSDSPCIDYGTSANTPATDIDGNSRGVDGRADGQVTADGSDYDIGAYEFLP